ncbi:MAG: putative phospholipid-translocating P-type ATPase, partial [Streblomastix strix]
DAMFAPASWEEKILCHAEQNLSKSLCSWAGNVECEAPSRSLINFAGKLTLDNVYTQSSKQQQSPLITEVNQSKSIPDSSPLTQSQSIDTDNDEENKKRRLKRLDTVQPIPMDDSQLLLKGCFLKNTAYAVGVCVYTGKETKMQQNTQPPKSKMSHLEYRLNWIIGIFFLVNDVIVILHAILQTVLENKSGKQHPYLFLTEAPTNSNSFVAFLINAGGAFVLYSYIIPISLFVSIELARIFQMFFLENDIFLSEGDEDEEQKKDDELNKSNKELKNLKDKLEGAKNSELVKEQ